MNDAGMQELKVNTIHGFSWRFAQQFLTQAVSFIISLVLARILMPQDYGTVALTTVFLNIANIVVINGFSSAVVQKQDLTEKEKSTVFFIGIAVSVVLYGILFLVAPLVSAFYEQDILVPILRVQSISIVIASLYSVQNAMLMRALNYKLLFCITLISTIFHGASGIMMALNGYGVWALTIPNLLSCVITCILTYATVKWRPMLYFSLKAAKPLFAFSSKVLLSQLFNTLYTNLKSLIIGKTYSSDMLGLYTRGVQFPGTIMTSIDSSMTNVMFSSLSKVQDSKEDVVRVLRRAMKTSVYICSPLMIGLAAVARPMVLVLLTDKWQGCIPFVQIMAIVYLTFPLSARIQALNAIGRSDITLKVNGASITVAIVTMMVSIPFGIYVFALSNLLACLVELSITFAVCNKVLRYEIKRQLLDILPPILLSCVMGACILSLSLLPLGNLPLLVLQVLLGMGIYIGGSALFKLDSYKYLLNMLVQKMRKNQTKGAA